MLLNSLFLALSSSIDSLGIGITYGIKNMKISFLSKLILFIISIIISYFSIFIGSWLNDFFSLSFSSFLGACFLIIIGFGVIIKTIFENTNSKNNYYDFDYSNFIDTKEAIFLGLALSLDSFGIGISFSLGAYNCFFFPIFISCFQFLFLSFGTFLGKKINNISKIPDFLSGILSGFLIILIGLYKMF